MIQINLLNMLKRIEKKADVMYFWMKYKKLKIGVRRVKH